MVWNLPILLTWLRILAIPLVIVLFRSSACVILPASATRPRLASCSASAGITDSLDGYLARRLDQTTALGAFLDPVADKLIVATALVLIVSRDARLVMVLAAVVIIGREIAVSALREWMAELGHRAKVRGQRLGKYKTIAADGRPVSLLLYRQRPVRRADVCARRLAHGHGGRAHAVLDAGVPQGGLALPDRPRLILASVNQFAPALRVRADSVRRRSRTPAMGPIRITGTTVSGSGGRAEGSGERTNRSEVPGRR